MSESPDVVVFDLGGVLIDWNPRELYRKLMADAAEMENFLANVCSQQWNRRQDAGRPFEEAVVELVARHPESRALIEAYWERWPEMLGGQIDATVVLLERLKRRGVPLYALSNWSAETWPHAQQRFAFLEHFEGLVISGFEGVAKPDPSIFERLLERYGLSAHQCLFIDDVAANVEAAGTLGLQVHQFTDAAALERCLAGFGLI